MLEEYSRKCRKQPLGTKEHAECMKKLAESIILQCIEDLWDMASMKQSAQFFSRRGFSICANIAGMDICEQVRLLDLVNSSLTRIRGAENGDLTAKAKCISSAPSVNIMEYLRAAGRHRN